MNSFVSCHILELFYKSDSNQRKVSFAQRNENQLGSWLTNYLADLKESVSKRITAQKPALGLEQVLFHWKSVHCYFKEEFKKTTLGMKNANYVTWKAWLLN